MHRHAARRRRLGHRDPRVTAIQGANDEVARFIVDWCGFHETCGTVACVRARRCRGEGVPCFHANPEACYENLADVPAMRRLFAIAIDAAEDALFE